MSAPSAPMSFAGALSDALQPANSAPTSGTFTWPVNGTVTSPFGERDNPMGPGQDFHPGIDIAADEGTPINAATAGRVVAAGPDGGYGNAVVVDDGAGMTTRYAHCSQIFARVGQTVDPSTIIAAVGSTGHSTGPHLHFEVRVNDKPVDPTQFLPR
ncbi:MAG: M23 family metallopeptidase [Candidatus Eremiobacteraeota bacterium]|nr:M23 family metallopeptidase [Candidatus Eremiobacteraeota bacterium]